MRAFFRAMLMLAAVLLLPVAPFVLCGPTLEARMGAWLATWTTPRQTAALVVGLLASDIVLPVPSSLVGTLAGGRLGWAGGALASWTGMTIGAALGFALARYGGRPIAARLASAEELQRMERLAQRIGPALLVMTRAVPVLAEACVLLLGLQRLTWMRFLPALALSNLGVALAYAAFGSVAADHHWLPLALGVSLALPLLLALGARRWLRSAESRAD